MKRRLDLVICESLTRPGLLSLRYRLPNGALGEFRGLLAEAGFRAGDRVALITDEDITAEELEITGEA